MSVLITGVGAIHPHGVRYQSLLDALSQGGPPPAGGIQGFRYKDYFPESSKRAKKMDRVGQYASCAALFAMEQAGLTAPPNPVRTGLVTGTMFGGLEACAAFHRDLVLQGPDNLNPVNFPNTSHNVACGQVAISLGIQGPVTALASGISAAYEAILTGARTLRSGRADMMLVGGFDRWIPELDAALGGLLPHPSEGSCFLILETEDHARARDARVLGRLLGYGQASDSVSLGAVDPEGRALARALRRALETSQVPAPASLVSGEMGVESYDRALAAAYREVLPESSQLPRRHPREVLGETFGASGCFHVAAALGWMADGSLPTGPCLLDGYSWGGAATALVIAGP